MAKLLRLNIVDRGESILGSARMLHRNGVDPQSTPAHRAAILPTAPPLLVVSQRKAFLLV